MTAAAALALLSGLAAYSGLRAERFGALAAGIGALAAPVLLTALAVRLPGLVAWAVALLGAAYAAALLLRGGTIDALAPVYAVGLLALAELAYWSIEVPIAAEPGVVARRAERLAVLALVAGGVSALVLAVSELAAEGGVLLAALGVAAAGGALGLVTYLAREARLRSS